MACSVPHSDDEIQALVQTQIDEDMVRQKVVLDLALQFDNACTAKEYLRKAYEKCNDIPQESCALIDTFLKEGSDKDYELNLSMYGKAAKIEKQMNAKLELHQLHLDEEALRETLEEAAMDEKAREEKIKQKQADDEKFFLEFGVEFGLDIDDFDFHLTPVMRSSSSTRIEPSPLTPNPVRIIPGSAGIVQLSSSTRVEPSPSTPNPVRIIPGPAGIVQQAKMLKEKVFILDSDGALMSTQEYMQKVVEDVGEDDDFKIKSCSPNDIDNLNVTMKDLSSTIPGTKHHKVIGDGGYGKDITVEAAMILANVSVFTPKPSKHYFNITMRNMVKVFRKNTVPESGSDKP
ncbi:GPCR kinase [Tanacetum coccineum]